MVNAHASARQAGLLPGCRDDVPAISPPISCDDAVGSHMRLCAGVRMILHNASCAQLSRLPFLVHVIQTIGLAGDLRGKVIYGRAVAHMIPWGGSRAGLWQDPHQIASAMLHLGSRLFVERQPLFRYVEVGVFTAWTSCVVAAFLTRAGGGLPFQGWAVDVQMKNIAPATLTLLKALNVSYVSRGQLDAHLSAPRVAGERPTRFDLCFIDGDHQVWGGCKREDA